MKILKSNGNFSQVVHFIQALYLCVWHFSPLHVLIYISVHICAGVRLSFPESSTGEEVGLPYSLKLLPWKVIAHSHVRGQCGPLGPMTNRAAVLRCVSGVFFHKAFYKSVTAPCLPFPPCTHALLSQQAPKELLRNAEPTHKLALLATLVILFLTLSSTFLSRVPSLVLNHGRLRPPRRVEQERRRLFGAWS